MDINDLKSELQMKDLFFPECYISRNKNIHDGELNFDLSRDITKIEDHVYEVRVKLSVDREDLKINVIAQATFSYLSKEYLMEEDVININTVAIIFPFIRTQVTLLSSQPGMQPIVLPAINTSKFK